MVVRWFWYQAPVGSSPRIKLGLVTNAGNGYPHFCPPDNSIGLNSLRSSKPTKRNIPIARSVFPFWESSYKLKEQFHILTSC